MPRGFRAGAATAGVKSRVDPDLSVVLVDGGAGSVAATFTPNRIRFRPGAAQPGAPRDGRPGWRRQLRHHRGAAVRERLCQRRDRGSGHGRTAATRRGTGCGDRRTCRTDARGRHGHDRAALPDGSHRAGARAAGGGWPDRHGRRLRGRRRGPAHDRLAPQMGHRQDPSARCGRDRPRRDRVGRGERGGHDPSADGHDARLRAHGRRGIAG